MSVSKSSPHPVTAVIVGAGHRSLAYAGYAKECPDELRIVGVADPNAFRRQQVAKEFNLPPEHCFESAGQLAAAPKFADAVINGTMDKDHVPTSLPLLAAGYDMLLEKPIATNEPDLLKLSAAAKQHGRKVMICHVLRYAPFYAAIKSQLLSGAIGQVLNMQTVEHVSYHHFTVGYVRGKWNRKAECGASVLLAKCCHDLDLIVWMMSGNAPRCVSSFGSNLQFRPERAHGAGTRCMVDCKVEAECLYSARRHFIDHPDRWGMYVWPALEHLPNPTIEDKIASMKSDNPHGRCAWKTGHDQVDHQSVVIEFASGATATHNLVGGAARAVRTMHILGTHGEIQGVFDDGIFVVRHIELRPGQPEYAEQRFDLNEGGDMVGAFGGHGGGDLRLVSDFVNLVRGRPTSTSCTRLDDSIYGHQCVFAADQAMSARRVIEIAQR